MRSDRRVLCCAMLGMLACSADPGYGGRSSSEWIGVLQDSSATARARAAHALGKVLEIRPRSPDVVRALIGALADTIDAVRMAAASALVAEGVRAEGAIPGIHAALHDTAHPMVRAHAATILGRLGTSAGEGSMPALIEALADSDARVRGAATEAIARFGRGAQHAVPALLVNLTDPAPDVRRRTLEALISIQPPVDTTVRALRGALSDSIPANRAAAAYMLGELGRNANPAFEELVSALEDPAPDVRASVVSALAAIRPGDQTSLGLIRQKLQDPDARVRRHAADAIATREQRARQTRGHYPTP